MFLLTPVSGEDLVTRQTPVLSGVFVTSSPSTGSTTVLNLFSSFVTVINTANATTDHHHTLSKGRSTIELLANTDPYSHQTMPSPFSRLHSLRSSLDDVTSFIDHVSGKSLIDGDIASLATHKAGGQMRSSIDIYSDGLITHIGTPLCPSDLL